MTEAERFCAGELGANQTAVVHQLVMEDGVLWSHDCCNGRYVSSVTTDVGDRIFGVVKLCDRLLQLAVYRTLACYNPAC